MHGKRASLIVNLRSGHTVLNVPEISAVLYAADWNSAVYLTAYSGETGETEEIHEKPKKAGKHRQYFLPHAGIGVDAAIMAHINKPLKYEVGKIAFDLAGLKELPRQRPFPVEISSLNTSGKLDLLWKGQAWQVIVNNSRLYAGTITLAPHAYIDDGILDVTVITAGGPLATLEEAVSFLLLHTVDTTVTR